ncbi:MULTISPECIES: hypothetical protein [Fervidobacterium]|uniref:Uncharacterized protein n=1 Tax=Fervidobacterium nodosum (strain ATCC 35602 / DSM 5306 / Rt17-B1) TaxID=381764 RepID=A7HLT8_FERNB|nr:MULTISPECIES: hypothetical protein [Fervidobacterium]ABS60871.1 hypothetical protein Fnod_1021 [Fervidobacterium nodosum Rt17-B1]KAF2962064.1 hypothetical protein AS161_06420 [Fervidobacterium sp. 2310opik-2]PHJ13811.1 hypothetical protein IM41_04420 [Fervidobacterium sp. SC_NGM5_G05]
MTNINAYSVLMFIANIVLAVPLILAVIQQSKASMNIANVVSVVYILISVGFFSGDFKSFFSKLGLSISPVAYVIIAILTFIIARDFSELRVRNGMRKAFVLGIIMVLINVIDFFTVKSAALIPLLSLTWAFVICIIVGLMKWNIE